MAAVEARSKTSLLQDALRLRTPTLRMLRDVLTFLIDQNAAARTTGSQVVLEDEFDIAPQQVNATLLWSASVVRRHAAATWGDLSRRFHEEIVPLFSKFARYGEVERRRENPMKVAIRIERGGSPIMGRTVEVDYDAKGLEARKEYVKQLSDLNRKLAGLGDLDLEGSAGELVGKLNALWHRHYSPLNDDLNDINWAHRYFKWVN